MKLFRSQRGYTLLFAVLTATLVLGVTVFILSVSRKQFVLSATARDSMTAFYSADAGIECAALVIASIDISQTPPTTLNCNGQNITVLTGFNYINTPSVLPGFDPTKNFYISPPNSENRMYLSLKREDGTTTYGCILFSVFQGTSIATGLPRTVVEARGYNLCDDGLQSPDTTSVRTVERALQLIRE